MTNTTVGALAILAMSLAASAGIIDVPADQPTIQLAINNSQPNEETAAADGTTEIIGINAESSGGGLYRIDPMSGASELLWDTVSVPPGGGVSNAVAIDVDRCRAYYTSFVEPAALYALDLEDGTTTTLGVLIGDVSCASVYQNDYYYFVGGTGQLRRVTFTPEGEILSDIALSLANAQLWGFGDIAIRGDGLLFGSGNRPNNVRDIFTINLVEFDGIVDYLVTDSTPSAQIAFAGDRLFGTVNDDIYEFDTATGDRTLLASLGNTSLQINDLATSPAYGPCSDCPGDLDRDGEIGTTDLLALLSAWGPCGDPCPQDLDGSGDVGTADLLAMLAAWGVCP